jgi:hypothetical protein
MFVSWIRDEVHEYFAGFQTAKRHTFAAIYQMKAELPVEFNGTSHIADRERHRANVLDHPTGLRNSFAVVYSTRSLRKPQAVAEEGGF